MSSPRPISPRQLEIATSINGLESAFGYLDKVRARMVHALPEEIDFTMRWVEKEARVLVNLLKEDMQ